MPARPLSECDGEFIIDNGRPAGVIFVCPACPRNAAGSCHSIMVAWVPALRDRLTSGNPVWTASGTESLQTLTLAPSIDCTRTATCLFHGFVTRGQVTW